MWIVTQHHSKRATAESGVVLLASVKARERADAGNGILFSPRQAYTGSSAYDLPSMKVSEVLCSI
jgi:hypothetical protein